MSKPPPIKTDVQIAADQVKKVARDAKKADAPQLLGHNLSLTELKRAFPTTMEDYAFVEHALKTDSPRAVALLAASHLDYLLDEQIRFRCTPSTSTQQDNLLKPGAPLSATETKANLLYCLGVFGEITRQDIQTICSVRNLFAHSPIPVTFDHQAIKNKCLELKALQVYRENGIRMVNEYSLPSSDAKTLFINTTMNIGLSLYLAWAYQDEKTAFSIRLPNYLP